MPRRNNRPDFEPLDLTPADVRSAPKLVQSHRSLDEIRRDRVARERRDRALVERQANARINGGIDWAVCLVPGCGAELVMFGVQIHSNPDWRDHTVRLPLCLDHLAVAAKQAAVERNDPLLVGAAARVIEREKVKRVEIHGQAKAERKARIDGHIYFVRLNGLVKAGWSGDVAERLRAYGPDVEVLCVYPGTRDDETNLHRQLRPVLARGREWYQDGPVVADFVAQAVAQHGEPKVHVGWTRPKEIVRPRKRGR